MGTRRSEIFSRLKPGIQFSWNQAEDLDGSPLYDNDGDPLYDPDDIVFASTVDEPHRLTIAEIEAERINTDAVLSAEKLSRDEAKRLLSGVDDIKDRIWDLVNWAADANNVPNAVKQGAAQLRIDIQLIRDYLQGQ